MDYTWLKRSKLVFITLLTLMTTFFVFIMLNIWTDIFSSETFLKIVLSHITVAGFVLILNHVLHGFSEKKP